MGLPFGAAENHLQGMHGHAVCRKAKAFSPLVTHAGLDHTSKPRSSLRAWSRKQNRRSLFQLEILKYQEFKDVVGTHAAKLASRLSQLQAACASTSSCTLKHKLAHRAF